MLLAADRLAAPGESIGDGVIATFRAFRLWASLELGRDVLNTLARVLFGFAIALTLGITVGLVTGRFSIATGDAVHVLNFLRAITPVALSPFFLIAFGISELSKILLISWGAFFPVWINTHLGIRSLGAEFVASARLIGLSGTRLIRHFYLPAAMRSAYPGARVAIGVAFILVYISETLGATYGVGYRLGVAYSTLQIPTMTAALTLLGILGLATDRAFVCMIRWLAPWIVLDKNDERRN